MGKMTDNTLNKQETQKRILIATVISLLFFIVYDFFYLQPQFEKQQAEKKVEQQVQHTTNTNSVDAGKNAPAFENKTAIGTNAAPQLNNTTNSDVVSTITTANSIVEIDSLGRISQVTLTNKTYQDAKHHAIKLFNTSQLRPLEVRFADANLNAQAFKTKVSVSNTTLDATKTAQTLVITQTLGNTVLTKTLKFYPEGHYDLDIKTSTKQTYFITPGFRPDVIADLYADHGALYVNSDDTMTIIEDKDLDKNTNLVGVRAISAFDRYYATVLYNFDKNHEVSVMSNQDGSPESFIHIVSEAKFHGYMGPKMYKVLNALDPKLTNIIEYGWFTFIAKPMFSMMEYIYNHVGNWGWTIVLVVMLVKLILFPLSQKGMVSMNRLKELAPKVKAIQEKYKDDKQKASMHMMELYKKEGANPMGGCLPILLQIPVFFAIYRVLTNSIELKGSEWILWINDLSVMDPYFVLPILMGITMYVQQKISPNQMQDEMQKKIFQFLPMIFTVFFLWFPAGLTLYWFVNNLFTVAQQYYVNQIFLKNKETRHEEHLSKKHNK